MKSAQILFVVYSIATFVNCNFDTSLQDRSHSITISDGGLVLINVLVADSINTRFILDTGAGIHVISNSLLRRIASVPSGKFTGFRHTGERVDFDIFRISAFSIGGFRQENPIVASWSVLDSFKIDGILSLKFFEHHPFTLDLIDSILVFETTTSLATKVSARQVVPLKVHVDRSKSLDVFTDFRVADSLKLECIIDSGSPGTVIDARYLTPLGIDTTSASVQKRLRKSLFGSSQAEYITAVSGISFWDDPSTVMQTVQTVFKYNLIYDGLIGTDFLIGRRTTFNIPDRQLIMRGNSQ